jgi:penicillin amidase
VRQWEGPLWSIVTQRPMHLLDPSFQSWDERLLATVDRLLLEFENEDGRPLADYTWGERNTTRIQHPLSMAIPRLSTWLDAPAEPLPGDSGMPRVQGPTFGASERFVVSPGREADGIFHMPGGQSGHFLSPYYMKGHEAWARGEATPFLPGEPEHWLTLTPSP